MQYLKNFFYNFLIVFFANYLLPGIDIVSQTKLPHLGGDFLVAGGLGLLGSLIYPVMKVLDPQVNLPKIGMAALVMSFAAYVILKFAPLGVEVRSVEGYLLGSIIVSIGIFATNYFDMKRSPRAFKFEEPPRMS